MIEKIIEITKKLISFKTTSDNYEELNKALLYISDMFKKFNKVKIYKYKSNKKPSLVITNLKNKDRSFDYILNGHIDVVPAKYQNAFNPMIKNNKLYGRGAMDMKSEIAVMCVVFMNLIELKTNKKIALMITSDEETGGFDGTRYLVEDVGYRAKCVILPDDGFYHKITIKEKGVLHLKIIAKGKSAHGSRPWLGKNSIEEIINIFMEIKKIFPKKFNKNKWINTLNIGKINGGMATNVVPDYAEAYLDVRFINKNDKTKIIEKIKKILKKYKNSHYQIIVEGDPLINDLNNFYIKKFLKIANKHKIKFNYHYGHGASDGRFFSKYNIPVIMWRPKSSEAHINNEWVDIKSLEKYYQILKEFLLTC
ncbi:MAG: ArgE/DapE family deacylase [Patescibacteria group bacterium]|nr:ArgE/DapE family deacylase [Patescibacteria group bacterium]MCX7955566.1 ArgE/DapE family deacylase [Patescibacteria group bacterium]